VSRVVFDRGNEVNQVSKRIELRERYMQAWYEMDAGLMFENVADSFIFDDPAEPEPVTRSMLAAYMQRWDTRTRALGANNEWQLSHRLRQDKDGLLTDWEWWQVVNTNLSGAAVIVTGDDGVLLERITYFDRDIRQTWAD
jgi:hypothetical protein